MFRRRTRQAARQAEIAAYIRQLRALNGGVGAADVARLAHQDGRDYTEDECLRVLSDMHVPGFPF